MQSNAMGDTPERGPLLIGQQLHPTDQNFAKAAGLSSICRMVAELGLWSVFGFRLSGDAFLSAAPSTRAILSWPELS